MPAFDYAAYDTSGKLTKGVASGDTVERVRRDLRTSGLLLESITPVTKPNEQSAFHFAAFSGRINDAELAMILRQQAMLIDSGLPLEQAMRMTAEQAETKTQRRLMQSWRSSLLEGHSLSAAMQRCPFKIADSVVAGVGVGEQTGHLAKVMMRLGEEIENSSKNRQTFSRALIYPVTLIVTAITVISIMMVWVVPQIVAVFETSGRALPLVTRIVIGLSDFVVQYGLVLLIAIAGVIVLSLAWLSNRTNRTRFHRAILSFPGVGKWRRMANTADWSRSLGALLQSGVPALTALRIASANVSNLYLRNEAEKVSEQMRQGSSLYNALKGNQLGSGFLLHMVGSGEASSKLDDMLLAVSEYYSSRLSASVVTFLQLVNPILIILMGLLILAIVAAVMLPIMDMNNMI